jgi:hypothetical protein
MSVRSGCHWQQCAVHDTEGQCSFKHNQASARTHSKKDVIAVGKLVMDKVQMCRAALGAAMIRC